MIQIQDILDETEIDFLLYDQLVYDIEEIEEEDITIKEFINDINKVLLQDKKYLYIRVLDCLYGIKYNQNMECALNVFFEFGKLSELYQKANTK